MSNTISKGIILAGGKGTRLHPLTKPLAKPLLPVYDKPLIYYPLSVLINLGIRDVLLIVTEDQQDRFRATLGDGSDFGINLVYDIQHIPRGIPDAFVIGEQFIGNDNVALILGDNIFDPIDQLKKGFDAYNGGGMVFGFPVPNPELYGVAEVDSHGNVLSMEEKPKQPKSNLAVIGLYLFDNRVISVAKSQEPSARGELEILESIEYYREREHLKLVDLGKEFNWFDAGAADAMLTAGQFVKEQEEARQTKLGSIELAALNNGFISAEQFEKILSKMPNCRYREQLSQYLK